MARTIAPTLAPDTADYLREILPPGATLYALTAARSRSNMTRSIRLFAAVPDESTPHVTARINDVTYRVAGIIGRNVLDGSDFRIFFRGAGVSAAAELAAELSAKLYGKPGAIRGEFL